MTRRHETGCRSCSLGYDESEVEHLWPVEGRPWEGPPFLRRGGLQEDVGRQGSSRIDV